MGRKVLPQIILIILVLFFISALVFFPRVILPFFFAFFLAFLLEPVVKWFERKGASRTAAVITVFLLLFVFCSVLVVIFLPGLLQDLNKALTKLPVYVRDIQKWYLKLNLEYKRFSLPQNIRNILNEALFRGEEFLRLFLLRLASLLLSFFSQILFLLLVPILAFYFSRDLESFRRAAIIWSKKLFQEDQDMALEVLRVITGYLRAQALSSLVVGIILTLGLLFLQVDLAVLIGALAGAFNLIPYFGPVIGAAPAIFLAAQTSLWKAIYVVVLFFIVNQLESIVIYPKIIGGKVGLHPLSVIFLLLIGGELFGFIGIVFAVPIGAVLQVIIKHYWKKVIIN